MNTIFITGASTGIGRATAEYFHAKGWNVIATMRIPSKETTLNKLDNVLVTALDVLDIHSIEKAVQEGINRFGKIDVLVNNAGYGAFGPVEAFERANILRQFNTNVIGLLDVSRAVLPHFRQNKSGTIINISSVGGKMAFPLGALYHGTKFAVEGISEAMNYEMATFGGRIKIVEPGAIATDFISRSVDINNDESMIEYQQLLHKIMTGMETLFVNTSPAYVVAEVIYTAATDGTDQLRYIAGEDAKSMIETRKIADDASFMHGIKSMFAL